VGSKALLLDNPCCTRDSCDASPVLKAAGINFEKAESCRGSPAVEMQPSKSHSRMKVVGT
jgi:hypothetical protein